MKKKFLFVLITVFFSTLGFSQNCNPIINCKIILHQSCNQDLSGYNIFLMDTNYQIVVTSISTTDNFGYADIEIEGIDTGYYTLGAVKNNAYYYQYSFNFLDVLITNELNTIQIINEVQIENNDTTICPNVEVTLNVDTTDSAYFVTSYAWNIGLYTASVNLSPDISYTYIVTATDINSCTASDNVIVNVSYADAGTNQTICLGSSTSITSVSANSYSWSIGEITQSINISPTITTTYGLTVENYDGCTASDEVVVNIGCARPENPRVIFIYNYNISLYQVDILWDNVPCATNYYVYRRIVGETNWTKRLVSSATHVFYVDSLTNYEFFVRTICNSGDTSLNSDTIRFTTIQPSRHKAKPINPEVWFCNLGNTYTKIKWEYPDTTGQLQIAGYYMRWNEIGTETWNTTSVWEPSALSHVRLWRQGYNCQWLIRTIYYYPNNPNNYIFSDFSDTLYPDSTDGCYKINKYDITQKEGFVSETESISNILVYPNPTNNNANISYSLGENTNVTIEVYGIMGQKISTICNEYQEAGDYNIPFPLNGSHGIYILKLTTPTKTFHTRIIRTE